MFENLRKWLKGEYKCIKCNETFRLNTFGYGTCICPECFEGERDFIFPDRSFIFNKLLYRWVKRNGIINCNIQKR